MMARRLSGAILTWISLDRGGDVSLSHQLEQQLREAILSGALPRGCQLPSSRALADELGISRPTAVLALDRLEAEGYLDKRPGAGTFVANSVPQPSPEPPARLAEENGPEKARRHVSSVGASLESIEVDIDARNALPFTPNTPAYDRFPFALWQDCVNRQTRMAYRSNLGYADPSGDLALRKAIATYLAVHRSDFCDPDQIVITAGAHSGFMLSALLLTNPGDGILVEDPGPYIARNMFAALARRVVNVPVNGEGMVFAAATAADPTIRMAFTMPSRQHPLGCTLSPQRRQGLLDWADATDSWIIEDDYDSEFRYTGRPMPSMRSYDRAGRVIYVGTFSKALFPALRIGYLVLPRSLVEMFRNASALIFRCAPLLAQMTLAEFVSAGHFATHLRRMRELYGARRDQFLAATQDAGRGLLQVERPDSGMNAMVWLPDGVDDRIVARQAKAAGVHGSALSDYYVRPPPRPGLILGFAGTSEHQYAPGLDILAQIVSDAMG